MAMFSFQTDDLPASLDQDALLTAPVPVAEGRSRVVYSLSGFPDLLLKIQKSEPAPRRFFNASRLLSAVRRYYKQVVPLRREIAQYRRVVDEGAQTRRHLQHFAGVVETSEGTGLVVSAVRRPDGQLGPTLGHMVKTGTYDDRSHAALQEFLDWFIASKLVAADVHLDNIVFDEMSGAMVLVDGIGDKTFLPVRSWVPGLNGRYKRKLAKTIHASVAICFMNRHLRRNAVLLLFACAGTALGIDLLDGQLIDG